MKAARFERDRRSFLLSTLSMSIPFVRVSTSARNATENDITFDMRHVACGDAARYDAQLRSAPAGAKFSDGMCREAGPDGYAKDSSQGEGERDPGRAMTNDKPVKNRVHTDRDETAVGA